MKNYKATRAQHSFLHRRATGVLVLAFIVAGCGAVSSDSERDASEGAVAVVVDQSHRFQTIEGFGAEPAQWFGGRQCPRTDTVPDSDKKRILDLLYGDLGLTGARTYIAFHGPGGDFDKFQELAAILAEAAQRARANDDEFHINVGGFISPSFRSRTGRLLPDASRRYADWATTGLLLLKKQGITVNSWDLGPEPDGVGNLTVPELKQLIVATGKAFHDARLSTQIATPRTYTVADAPEYAMPLLRNIETRQYIGQLDFHEYDYDASQGQKPDIDDRRTIRNLAGKYKLTVAMRETSTDVKQNRTTFWNGTYDQAMTWVNDLMTDMVEANASAWDLISADYIRNNPGFGVDAYLVMNYQNCVYTGFDIPPHYWTLRQFVKFVRPGAVRVAAKSNFKDVRVAAFADAKLRETVLVLINNSLQNDRNVEISGLPSGFASATVTTATEHGVQLPDAVAHRTQVTAVLPPRSVATFIFPE